MATPTEAVDDPFLAACLGRRPTRTPVWFMRQAGRSLPEYRTLRGVGSILDTIRHPELAAEITLQPVRRYGVDAAILYSDIMVPAAATGFGVNIEPGIGPVVEQPFRGTSDLPRIRPLVPEVDAPYVADTVRLICEQSAVPVIGFAGGPFTVASYLIEGQPSRSYQKTKRLMWSQPAVWAELVDRLADQAIASLRAQITAGARAIQLFDSWIGALGPSDYRAHVLPASRKVFQAVAKAGVPAIHFGVGTSHLVELMAEAGPQVVGLDWRTPLTEGRRRLGPQFALQGNLDPVALLAGWPTVRDQAIEVLRSGSGGPHVFNLGHGVLPETDPSIIERLVELVHSYRP